MLTAFGEDSNEDPDPRWVYVLPCNKVFWPLLEVWLSLLLGLAGCNPEQGQHSQRKDRDLELLP